MSGEHSGKKIDWRMHLIMAARRIRSVAELQRRLHGIGVTISSTQLSRLYTKKPERLNIDILEGLMTVLDCTASDLMPAMPANSRQNWSHVPEITDEKRGRGRPRTRTRDMLSDEELLGPAAKVIQRKEW